MGFLALGLKLLPMIVEAITWVERFVSRKGRAKQDAAVYLIKSILGITEEAIDRNILDDDEVEAATRTVIDAVVALQNLVARKHED
jgi:hypothetical protein